MKKRAPKLPEPSEHESQVAFFARLALDPRTKDLPIFAIPNGGKRHVVTAMHMKREGVRAGVPDIFVAVACPSSNNGPKWNGLFLEMKKPGKYPTPKQAEWHALLRKNDYCTATCYSAADAWDVLTRYLGIA